MNVLSIECVSNINIIRSLRLVNIFVVGLHSSECSLSRVWIKYNYRACVTITTIRLLSLIT